MQCLADGDEIHGIVIQAGCLGRGDAIADGGVRDRRVDLRLARIGGDDSLEMPRERNRRLPVAGRAVPRKPTAGKAREINEQFIGIMRPVARVARRLEREMVFEGRPGRHYMLQEGVFPACFASL